MKHVIVGMALIGLGAWGMIAWWDTFAQVMRGLIPFALLAVGLVALLSGSHRMGASEKDLDEEIDAHHGGQRPRGQGISDGSRPVL